MRRRRLCGRGVEDGLDVVAVGIDDEPRVAAAAVLGTQAGRAVVRAAIAHRGGVPTADGVVVVRAEGDVGTRRDAVASQLAADAVQAEVVALAAPERDVRVALEDALGEHGEAELSERRLVQPPARTEVGDADVDMVDDAGHDGRGYAAPRAASTAAARMPRAAASGSRLERHATRARRADRRRGPLGW